MNWNVYKILKYQLYIFQVENYEIVRFWKLLLKRGWFPRNGLRKDLVWTSKAKLIFFISVLIHLLFLVLFILSRNYAFLFVFSIVFFLYPVIYSCVNILIWPLDYFVKFVLVFRAKLKIKDLPIKIIGVAGSYGKTTMKEVLAQVLSSKYQVGWTPESVNTPVGIARWILKEVDARTEILIVEMGEHYKGDVVEICNITKPDISVVTGINEAHLERMGTLKNIVDTIFEIVSSSNPKSLVLINGEDKNVVDNYKKYIWPDHRILRFQISDLGFKNFNTEKLVWKVNYENFGEVEVNLLGEYALGDVDAAIKIAKELGMTNEEIKKGIEQLKPVEHRLQPIKSNSGVLVIDDSYNGNPTGVAEAIKVLSRFNGRRKVYITPGLVEIGKATKEIHLEIGRQLAGVADVVILIKNSVTGFIAEGIGYRAEGRVKPEIIWFDSAAEAHAALGKILKTNDVVLFQNDWGDNYL